MVFTRSLSGEMFLSTSKFLDFLSPVKNIKLALVYAFSIGHFAIVPTGQVIVTAFNENTKEEIMMAEGSLSPSDKVVTRGLRDQKPATKASKSDDSFNPYEEDDSVNRETEEIFNPYLEDGAGSSSVDQLLLALAKSLGKQSP